MMPTEQWVTNEIKALEQAHAELAAKVEQMISKACQDCAVCEGRGWSINVPSQSMYPCRWCGGSGKRSTIEIASLESPAPAPDPVCAICGGAGKRYTNGYCESCNGSGLITERVACANSDCGHTEDLHTHPAFGLGFCLRCPCPDYVPTAEPAPLDPVLVDRIAVLIANRVLHPNEVFMTGPYRVPSEEKFCKEAAREIVYMLTISRDGAR